MDFVLDLLMCPFCSGRVHGGPAEWTCTDCGHSGAIDDLGIIHLQPDSSAGAAISQGNEPGGSTADRAAAPKSVASSVERLIGRLASQFAGPRAGIPDQSWTYLTHFAPNRYGYALLGATYAGTTSLVLRSGWGSLVRVITQLGGQAIGIDGDYKGLFYSARVLRHPGQALVHSRSLLPLPFRDASFDNVFWEVLSEQVPNNRAAGADVWQRPDALLRDCKRVLKPKGRLILTVRNGASLWRKHPVPAPFSEAVGSSAMRQKEPTRPTSRFVPGLSTKLSARRLLEKIGYHDVVFNVLWPDAVRWSSLLPAQFPLPVDQLKLSRGSLGHKVRTAVFRGLSRGHMGSFFVPGYCIVARKDDGGRKSDGQASPSTVELIARSTAPEETRIEKIDSHPNSKSLSFRLGDKFVKIALADTAENDLISASDTLDVIARAEKSDGEFFVPVEFRRVAGAAFAVSPHVQLRTDHRWEDRVARLEWALDRLSFDARPMPLRVTDFWRRVTSDQSRADFAGLGGGQVLMHLEQSLAEKSVLAGVVHGDLTYHNLFRDPRDTIVAIDWDRSECASPKLLDAVRACYALARGHHRWLAPNRRGSDGIVIAWQMVIEADPVVPLLDRVHAVKGELDWQQAIGIALLDEVERGLRSTHASPVSRLAADAMLRSRFALACKCLLGAGAAASSPGG